MPLAIVSVVIAVGATLVIVLTGDETGSGGSASSAPAGQASSGSSGEGAAAEGGPGQVVAVEIAGFEYDPEPVTVKAGTEIAWTNTDSAPHTATADDGSFDTGNLDQDQTGSVTFGKPGEIGYICDIHPFMVGSVIVE